MKLRDRGDAGVPQGPRAVICKNAEVLVPGRRQPAKLWGDSGFQEAAGWRTRRRLWDGGGRRQQHLGTSQQQHHHNGSSSSTDWGESPDWRQLQGGTNRSGPAGCITAWCSSFPEPRQSGAAGSQRPRPGRKPVGRWDPHHPSNSLPPPPTARRCRGMGAELGTRFIPQAIWRSNPHTNSLTATVSHHNLPISNLVHFLASFHSCCIWVGARDRRSSLLQ